MFRRLISWTSISFLAHTLCPDIQSNWIWFWVCVFVCLTLFFVNPFHFFHSYLTLASTAEKEREELHQYSNHVTSMYSNAHVSLMSSPIFIYTTFGLIWRETKNSDTSVDHYYITMNLIYLFFWVTNLANVTKKKYVIFIKYFHNLTKIYFTTKQFWEKYSKMSNTLLKYTNVSSEWDWKNFKFWIEHQGWNSQNFFKKNL